MAIKEHTSLHVEQTGGNSSRENKATSTDPVCGMTVDPESAQHQEEFGGETYYFCSDHCWQKFADDPGQYCSDGGVNRHAKDHDQGECEGATYTCPMHSEVHEDRPGACPSCGMDLEAESPATKGTVVAKRGHLMVWLS